jgi:hypothetical protein
LQIGYCRVGSMGLHDRQLGVAIWIAERQTHQEPVELALGQPVGAFLLDGVLRGDDHERFRQHVARAVGTDLALLHRFEQRRLSLR